ncbi:MAG: hypothetical protein ACM3SV_05995 [Betaproteobacteria bacterium]
MLVSLPAASAVSSFPPDYWECPEGDGFLLTYIEEMPERLKGRVRAFRPDFSVDCSETDGRSYWMNHCPHCGVHLGDFYVSRDILDLVFRDPSSVVIDLLVEDDTGEIYCDLISSDSLGHFLNQRAPLILAPRGLTNDECQAINRAGFDSYFPGKGGKYINPYPSSSAAYDEYERGWTQALKRNDAKLVGMPTSHRRNYSWNQNESQVQSKTDAELREEAAARYRARKG